jgi:hypothetical protein
MRRPRANISRRASFGIAVCLLVAILAAGAVALGFMLTDDSPETESKSKPQASARLCSSADFPAAEFAGCLRNDFNAQQEAKRGDERLVEIMCTEVTAELAETQRKGLPVGYRYFGCRLVFSEDGGANAVIAWHRTPVFSAGVTIERIKWDEGAGLETP